MYSITEFDAIFDKIYPEQINLKSFESKDHLCPSIWVDNELKKSVRPRLYAIAKNFVSNLDDNMEIPIWDVVLVGSIAGFNWSKYSDIDLHVMVNYEQIKQYGKRETLKALFDMKKNDWNSKHDILIYGYPVEMYIQFSDEENASDGIYSIKYSKWVKIPQGGNEITHKDLIRKQAARYINIIDKIEDAATKAKSRKQCKALYDEMDKVHDEIVQGRKLGLATEEREYAPGNLVFKILRRTGHLGKTNDVKRYLYDKITSFGVA